ncbi:HU family DNA-binding protein [Peribacillus frigoritolerans]|jgi:DNA-binding protein HU-beta|uniref:HU family DNA-binding protein n=1 Tax=Peribacillus castrilensis TaxID=2897690 RepID=A0AAW9NPM6_9BACI|nr:HU family DNA-binding protein [Peribacillus castrilensis]
MTKFKTDIIAEYAQLERITKVEAEKRINTIFELVTLNLENGEDVKIANFFNFFIRERESKDAINPQTGEYMVIEATRTCVAKMTKPLKARVQG